MFSILKNVFFLIPFFLFKPGFGEQTKFIEAIEQKDFKTIKQLVLTGIHPDTTGGVSHGYYRLNASQ